MSGVFFYVIYFYSSRKKCFAAECTFVILFSVILGVQVILKHNVHSLFVDSIDLASLCGFTVISHPHLVAKSSTVVKHELPTERRERGRERERERQTDRQTDMQLLNTSSQIHVMAV